MAVSRPAPFEAKIAVGIGGALIGVTFTVIGLLLLSSLQMSGLPVALFLTPVLLAASWPAFVRQARRERDLRLAQLLVLALCLKLFGSLLRYWVAIYVYDGFADALMYHDFGTELAMRFRGGKFDTGLDSLSGTDFIRFFTGTRLHRHRLQRLRRLPALLLAGLLGHVLPVPGVRHRRPRRQPAQLRPPAVLPAVDAVLALQHRQGSLDAVHDRAGRLRHRPAAHRPALAWAGPGRRGPVARGAGAPARHRHGRPGPGRRLPCRQAAAPARGPRPGGEAVRPGRPRGRGRSAARPDQLLPAGEGHRPPGGGHQRARRERPPDRPGRVDLQRPFGDQLAGEAAAGHRHHLLPAVPLRGPQRPGRGDGAGEHPAAVPDPFEAPRGLAGPAPSPPPAVCGLRGRLLAAVRVRVLEHRQLRDPRPRADPGAAVLPRPAGGPGAAARPGAGEPSRPEGRVDADRQLARA